jgi:hypothetical protein
MAQLLVYKGKALTAAEVLSNYNTTKSRFSWFFTQNTYNNYYARRRINSRRNSK